MAKTKSVQKKTPAKKPVKKAVKAVKKSATKTKPVKPAAKKTTAKKKAKTQPMTKFVVDRMSLPKGGKIYVKAAKRSAAKKPVKSVKKGKQK